MLILQKPPMAGNIYTLGVPGAVAGTINTPLIELIAGSTKGFRLLRVGVEIGAGTASRFGFGRPAATGITPTTPVSLLSTSRTGHTASAATAVAWGTPPTVPAAYLFRVDFAATIGSNRYFEFDELYVEPGKSLVFWNISAVAIVTQCNFLIEEDPRATA